MTSLVRHQWLSRDINSAFCDEKVIRSVRATNTSSITYFLLIHLQTSKLSAKSFVKSSLPVFTNPYLIEKKLSHDTKGFIARNIFRKQILIKVQGKLEGGRKRIEY